MIKSTPKPLQFWWPIAMKCGTNYMSPEIAQSVIYLFINYLVSYSSYSGDKDRIKAVLIFSYICQKKHLHLGRWKEVVVIGFNLSFQCWNYTYIKRQVRGKCTMTPLYYWARKTMNSFSIICCNLLRLAEYKPVSVT